MKQRHSIVCASYLILTKDKEVLLLRRYNTGYEDGNYSVPAGHVDADEPVSETLVREAKEEVGVTIKHEDIEFKHVMHRKATKANDERLDFFFTCKHWQGEVKNMEPNKCDDLSWFTLNKLPKNIIPYIKTALENVARSDPYSELHWRQK